MQQPNPFDDKTIRQGLGSKSLDEIADWMASAKPDSQSIQIGQVEFSRRLTKAAEETAKHTKSNAHYMMWSVIVIAITSILNALFAFLNWYVPHVPH
jgi:hypothetical protein